MNLHFGLRRSARSIPVAAVLTAESPKTGRSLSDRNPADMPSAEGGLIAHYARRQASAAHELAVADKEAGATLSPVVPIGRGTAEHDAAIGNPSLIPADRRSAGQRPSRREQRIALKQRLIAACLVVTLCIAGLSGTASAQQRYRVQSGDTLESVATQFGVDPEGILRSSWLANPPALTPGDVIIIPDPGQTPEEAALTAAENDGTSPWTVGAYWVEEGDTIESIAAAYGVDAEALLEINGLTWSDVIYPGDRLTIPGTGDEGFNVSAAVSGSGDQTTASGTSLRAQVWVPTHKQEHSLSCEYAAAFIATSAFSNPVPEWVFQEAIPVTSNPHYGYRGDIDGSWGNYDDYGIYPESLVPVLNDYGYAAEVFYSMGDTSQLTAQLDAGHPVMVWLAFWGDTGNVYSDEDTYTVFAGMHVETAYGYDDDGVYLSDPGSGSYRYMDWGTFTWMWGTIDGMSLAVYPY